jgi:hypothetical protein
LKLALLSEPIRYQVVRQERTLESGGEYVTNMDITLDVELNQRESGLTLEIDQFVGKDLDGGQNNTLKKNAPQINGTRLMRDFDERGPVNALHLKGDNNGGWAGMMAYRALGMMEYGFMDVRYPEAPLGVGATWRMPIYVFGHEEGSGLSSEKVSREAYEKELDGVAEYELASIEIRSGRTVAEVLFTCSAEEINDEAVTGSPSHTIIVEDRGTIWIDLQDGWPVKSEIVRTVTVKSRDRVDKARVTTSAERLD